MLIEEESHLLDLRFIDFKVVGLDYSGRFGLHDLLDAAVEADVSDRLLGRIIGSSVSSVVFLHDRGTTVTWRVVVTLTLLLFLGYSPQHLEE